MSTPYENVLDLGAGKGDDLHIAKKINDKARLFAIESYEPNTEWLRAKGIEVYSGDIEHSKFPFKDESMDIVIANQIFEHTKELFWIFHETSRVLRPHGKLIVGVPNLAALHNRLLLLFGRQPSPLKNNSAHIRGFTKSDILQFLESCFPAGFSLSAFRGSNFYPFPPVFAKPLARAFPNMAWGIFMLFEKTNSYNGQFLEYLTNSKLETNFRMS